MLATKPTTALLSIVDVGSTSAFTENVFITNDNDDLFEASEAYKSNLTTVISDPLQRYLDKVEGSEVEGRQYVTTYPVRFDFPNEVDEFVDGATGNENRFPNEWRATQRKILQNCLIPGQINENPLSFYAYTNFNCLNFVSSSNLGTECAIVYPNFSNSLGVRPYSPAGPFTLDFFIKPKAPAEETGIFRAGTIFHITSSICVSLISGSQVGPDNKPDSFRILLQLSQSADRLPTQINPGLLPLSSPDDLIFSTDDILKRDTWHRVTIRWGTNTRSYGSGSIRIDKISKSFNVNSSSISDMRSSDALVIGNYYNSGDRVGKFFNSTIAASNGTITDPDGSSSDPAGFGFNNPLNAEVHHLSLFKDYLDDDAISGINYLYSASSTLGGPSFFLPVFFTSSVSSYQTYVTPGQKASLSTDSPISYHLSLGYNANFLNFQNFIIDFSQKSQPRAFGAEVGSAIPTATRDYRTESADDYLMSLTTNRRRNFSILPCDNGQIDPDFSILTPNSASRFYSINGSTNYSFLSLENLAPETNSYFTGREFDGLSYDGSANVVSLSPYTVYMPLFQNINSRIGGGTRRTRIVDFSSNRAIIFTIPAAYYLNRIVPGSFIITDSNLSGSGGISVSLRDDERGNLYRSNTQSSVAKWNRVGAIFYSHGIVSILTPHIPFFGKNGFSMEFRGEVRKTVASFTIPASPSALNSSINQTYKPFPPTQNRNEQSDDFTYITGINLHDDNLNVIMRARLAQSVQKREGDEIVFRLRYDL